MIKKIHPKELYDILKNEKKDKDFICIDVRTEDEYKGQHIEKTVNIPLDQLEKNLASIRQYGHICVVCASGNRSGAACEELIKNNFHNVSSLEGGIGAWHNEKLPLSGKNAKRTPLMQQVFITAGSLILFGCIFGFTFHEFFFFIPLGISIGLIYAGFSGNCLMTKVLSKMPWNR